MDSTLIVVLASIVIFFLLFIILFLFRERIEVQLEDDSLLLRYPFKKRKIQLNKELISWKVQEAYYLRLGMVYSINMLLSDGRRIALSSRFNHDNYEKLYNHLSSHYPRKREADK